MTLLDQLKDTLTHHRVSLVAYVLMPSHIHLLLVFERIELMSEFVQNFKRLSAHRLKPLISSDLVNDLYVSGKFGMWQPRFDDVQIWSEKQFQIKIEYIHNNPVKAGLVQRATDFEYPSARNWLSEEEGLVPVDKDWSWLKEN